MQFLNKEIVFDQFKFYWGDDLWLDYISKSDFNDIVEHLLEGMDNASREYVENHISLLKLLPFKDDILVKTSMGWTQSDMQDVNNLTALISSQGLTPQEAFLRVNKYGMKDLPQEIIARIDGQCVIDGGAYTGDTLLLFHTLFPSSRIFAFEPQKSAFEQLKRNIIVHNIVDKSVPICRGLSNKEEDLTLYTGEAVDSGATCNASAKYDKVPTDVIKTTTIDTVLKNTEISVGLIKLDIEGLEHEALEGAKETIQKSKPVLICAIYHKPEDFFELKQYIKELNPEYKFMIRRSEMVIPMADLVLIAY